MTKPKLHFTPTKNWLNDPNGFIYFKGEYHLFYQHFPYETKWGTMHWGHKTSKDLVHWQDHGIALYPSMEFDRNGCFSGSAIEIDGEMYLYYTAIIYNQLNPKNIHVTGDKIIASQALITSKDGYTFDNYSKKVVVPAFKEGDKIGHINNTRDPKVWKENDTYYMVLGSQFYDEKSERMMGEILFYTSSDAFHWQYQNRLINNELNSNMWECPDLFKLDKNADHYILIMSPENILKDGMNYPSHATWSFVKFNPETCEASMQSQPCFLDYGLDLYAPQTTVDKEGRRMVISWLRMPSASEDGKWNGLFTFPRLIEEKNGHIYFKVHSEIENQFTKQVNSFTLDNAMKISVDMKEGSQLNIGGYKIWIENQCVHTDRSQVFINEASLFNKKSPAGKTFATPILKDGLHLDIYTDTQVIEVYANDGEYVISNIVYGMSDFLEMKDIEKITLYEAD